MTYRPMNSPKNTQPPRVTSAYRADFYLPKNIYGFTGSLHNKPTVYFLTETEYGHITQKYSADWNIGRERVGNRYEEGFTYKISNGMHNGKRTCLEVGILPNGKEYLLHPSRGPLRKIRSTSVRTRAILSQAIWGHRDEKVGEYEGKKKEKAAR